MEEYDYAFVEEIPTYKSTFDNVTKDSGYSDYSYCDKFMDQSNHPDDYKNICIFLFKGLMYIHNNKKNAIPEGGTENLTKKNCQYLIYRLNHELRNIKEHPCNTSIFIQKVNSYISNLSSEYNICENEIKELGSIVFNNIEVLNVLYKHLNNYIYGSFKKHEERCNCAKKCAELYDNLLPHCYLYKSTFCNALIKFGNRYNQYLAGEDKCPELKKCLYFPQTENRNSEFTPLGEWLRSKTGKTKRTSYDEDEESYQVASGAFQSKETNPRRIGYRIAYN
ncbi:PIR Superfamily Protein [Plasmodium ovale curtisi]|uniref:PIR Superfamily Protein n=1 Tax=Plasmodium ovale curtisi TaxID=864141 RepID=A0A1A8VPI3_PLAOA|nr:PIR Superfamily Protein [Plasmodium ovale curtisi]